MDRIQTEVKELQEQMQIERSKREQDAKELAALEKQIEEVDRLYTPEDQLESVQVLCKCMTFFTYLFVSRMWMKIVDFFR